MSERQMVKSAAEARGDHRKRYVWARDVLLDLVGEGALINDLACGCGYGSEILTDFRVYGADVSTEAIDHAQLYFDRPGATFEVLDLESEAPPAAAAVISFETIEHVQDDAGILKKFAAAAPILLGSVPNQEVVPFDKRRFPFHLRHYTPAEIGALLVAAGYTSVEWFGQHSKQGEVDGPDGARTLVFIARRS